jgi:hypothetical protein
MISEAFLFGLLYDTVHGFFRRILERYMAAFLGEKKSHTTTHATAADHGNLFYCYFMAPQLVLAWVRTFLMSKPSADELLFVLAMVEQYSIPVLV